MNKMDKMDKMALKARGLLNDFKMDQILLHMNQKIMYSIYLQFPPCSDLDFLAR